MSVIDELIESNTRTKEIVPSARIRLRRVRRTPSRGQRLKGAVVRVGRRDYPTFRTPSKVVQVYRLLSHTRRCQGDSMSEPITISTEWLAPGDVDAVSATVESALASQGGKVQGLDADFGSALKMRLLGTMFSGLEDNMPFHLHVDIRPGTSEHTSHLRVEMRSTEGWYAFRMGFVDEQYHQRFDTVVGAVKQATGEASA